MPLELDLDKFKKDYVEQKSSQGIDPDAMNKHVSGIYNAAPASPIDNMPLAQEQAQSICDRMQALGMNNFAGLMDKFQLNASQQDAKTADSIKETMEGIAYVVETSQDPAKIAKQFSDRNFVCKEGTLTNLQAMLGEMSLSSSGIDAYFTEQKKQLVTQTATDMYRSGKFAEYPWIFRQYQPMEIHNVTSLTNTVASEYGLIAKSKEEDKYLSNISSSSQRKLHDALDKKLQSEEVISSMLERVAMNVNFNLPVYDKETYKGNQGGQKFYSTVDESLDALKLVEVKGGNILDPSALLELNGYVPQGYKKNVESIIKDAITIHLHDKGVMKHPEIDFLRLKIVIEKSVDGMGDLRVEKDTLDQAQGKNCLDKSMKYIIDNNIKLDADSCGIEDPVKYAIDNKIKIDGKDPKQYALESIIEQYLKSQNPDEKKLLEDRYRETHQLGMDMPVELLGVDSNLGKFLDAPSSAKIIAEYKGVRGYSVTEDIDFTKCDLALIEKCVKVTEQSAKEKTKDYDKLSTTQKVGLAFSIALGGPAAAVVYSAMKSHNAAKKKQADNSLSASVEDIYKDLAKVIKPGSERSVEQPKKAPSKLDTLLKRGAAANSKKASAVDKLAKNSGQQNSIRGV